jgi:hypothetical protein
MFFYCTVDTVVEESITPNQNISCVTVEIWAKETMVRIVL